SSRCVRASTWRCRTRCPKTEFMGLACAPDYDHNDISEETPVQTFKAYRTFEQDKVVQSRFVDMTVDDLDPGDVVIRTKYSTINYKDALSYNGAGKIMRKYPTVAGIDMAGTVERSNDPRWRR